MENAWFSINPISAGAFGVPNRVPTIILVSLLTPAPQSRCRTLVDRTYASLNMPAPGTRSRPPGPAGHHRLRGAKVKVSFPNGFTIIRASPLLERVDEQFKSHAWKACLGYPNAGSNPPSPPAPPGGRIQKSNQRLEECGLLLVCHPFNTQSKRGRRYEALPGLVPSGLPRSVKRGKPLAEN